MKSKNKIKNIINIKNIITILLLCVSIIKVNCYAQTTYPSFTSINEPYAEINNNKPYFTEKDYKLGSFETYSKLDSLGRCGVAFANIGKEIMPTEKRGAIGMIKPSGWNQAKYPGVIESNPSYLYNRCHLIGFQLAGENANEKNLITGTRYLNVTGMLPFEDKVADYVNKTNKHVLYRVTPVFKNNNLVASGVLIEASSTEDKGKSLQFCVYCFNAQPGIDINYLDGSSSISNTNTQIKQSSTAKKATQQTSNNKTIYIGNKNSKKFHKSTCKHANTIKDSNKTTFNNRAEATKAGYEPCKVCNP